MNPYQFAVESQTLEENLGDLQDRLRELTLSEAMDVLGVAMVSTIRRFHSEVRVDVLSGWLITVTMAMNHREGDP
jgi:hypothetical protein